MQEGRIKDRRDIATNFLHLGMIQVSNALLQILLFPIIIRKTGIDAFGPVVVANSFAALFGLVVNFGTSISGVQGVSSSRNNRYKLSSIFCQTLMLRMLLGILCFAFLPLVKWFWPGNFWFLLLAMPLVVAELINPLYFFNGVERLFPYNIANLLAKLAGGLLIIFLVTAPAMAGWVNFYLGLPSVVLFAFLNLFLVRTHNLIWVKVSVKDIRQLLRSNLPLAGNNLAVQLQQSFFLFALSAAGNSLWLSAYAIVDKVIWGFRLVLIAFSNALFPKAIVLAASHPEKARKRKRQINMVLAVIFLFVALCLYTVPGFVVWIFAGTEIPLANMLVRAIAFVPLLAAMNLLNVVEFLVQQRYADIFRIALLLTLVTISASLFIIKTADIRFIAFYPLLLEATALVLYLLFLAFKNRRVGLAG